MESTGIRSANRIEMPSIVGAPRNSVPSSEWQDSHLVKWRSKKISLPRTGSPIVSGSMTGVCEVSGSVSDERASASAGSAVGASVYCTSNSPADVDSDAVMVRFGLHPTANEAIKKASIQICCFVFIVKIFSMFSDLF